MKRITIQDLAKMLSLNPSTISRALSDHKDVNVETRKRVLAAAKEFNYVPNLHARYFRKKNSGLIALILPEFNMFFTHSIMAGINKILTDNKYTLIVFYSNNNYQSETEIIRHCISWVVDGVLLIVSDETHDLGHLDDLNMANIPVVLFDKVVPNKTFTTVTIDDAQVAYSATQHLIKLGAKNVLGVFAHPSLDMSQKRCDGFVHAVSNAGIQANPIYIHEASNIEKDLKLIDLKRYDGIFIMSDELIINMLGAMSRKGILAENYKFAAISDGVLPKNVRPFVPHMLHSGIEVGQIAATELIEKIKSDTATVKQIKVQTSLISEP